MIIGGSGQQATTLILAGKMGDNPGGATSPAYQSGTKVYNYVTSGLKTALSISGSGHLSFSIFESNSTSSTGTVKITVDGIVVLNDTQNRNIGNNMMIQVGSYVYGSGFASISRDRVVFNTSLLVEVSCNVFATYNYDYFLN